MKIYSLLLFLALQLTASSAILHEKIGDGELVLLKESYDLYNSKGESVKFYQERENEDLHYLLTHILHDKSGDCSGKSIEDGTYKIEGDTLVLYSFWKRSGAVKDAPYGAKVTRYILADDGRLKRFSSKIYIEAHKRSNRDSSGMQYLFKTPSNDQEKAALASYVALMEKYYEGDFVFGDEAKRLMAQVQAVLKPKKKSVWKQKSPF